MFLLHFIVRRGQSRLMLRSWKEDKKVKQKEGGSREVVFFCIFICNFISDATRS